MKEKDLLNGIRHVALATVNEDGSPHNTPLFFIFSTDLSKYYFGSKESAQHTQNFIRDGKGYVIVYSDDDFTKGALYLTIHNGHKVSKSEMPDAMVAHNAARVRHGWQPLPNDFYPTKYDQHMYVGDIAKIEKYTLTKDGEDYIKHEQRTVVKAEELALGD